MDRRTLLALAGAMASVPTSLFAQSTGKIHRIAILDDADERVRAESWGRVRARLRELGYVEGRTVAYESRYARGATERLPALAEELVALKPDVIVCASTPATSAAIRATASIPIVFIALGDPVGTGLVTSLARPGGNATGNSVLSSELAGKRLELMQEIAPGAKRLAYLNDTSNVSGNLAYRRLLQGAKDSGISIRMLDVRRAADLERAFELARREKLQGLIVTTSAQILVHRDRIISFAAENRIPAVYGRRDYVDAGGLVSYTADSRLLWARGADYVDRILRGAAPADLPVEQATNFRMVLNLKTARALGIAIPASLRLRADELIE